MSIFKGEDEIFIPNCSPDEQASTEGRIVYACSPKLEKGPKILQANRPTKVVIEHGEKAIITDDGGAPDIVLDRLMKWLEKRLI